MMFGQQLSMLEKIDGEFLHCSIDLPTGLTTVVLLTHARCETRCAMRYDTKKNKNQVISQSHIGRSSYFWYELTNMSWFFGCQLSLDVRNSHTSGHV